MRITDGQYTDNQVADDRVGNALDLVGEELMRVTGSTERPYLEFAIQTNVLNEDVLLDFQVIEE